MQQTVFEEPVPTNVILPPEPFVEQSEYAELIGLMTMPALYLSSNKNEELRWSLFCQLKCKVHKMINSMFVIELLVSFTKIQWKIHLNVLPCLEAQC